MTHKIAQTILSQLGGNKFISMTGAKELASLTDGGLSMKLGRVSNGVSHVRIILDDYDTYTMDFLKWNSRKLSMEKVKTVSLVSVDIMGNVFTNNTGLYLGLRG